MNYLIIGFILILALFAIRFSNKYGVPALLLFILLGMGFTAAGFEFEDYVFADQFATLALMVIIFYGGFGTNWTMAKPVARESIVLSSLGVVITAITTGLFTHFVLGFELLEGLLIGSVVGSTDFASVSNILRSKNLNLKYNTASLLELESGSNDPTAFTMTMVFLSVIAGTNISIPFVIFTQIVFGVGIGFAFAYGIGKLLNKISFRSDGLYAVFMAAAMLITFGASSSLGGNGFLSVYILGIYLGNMEFKGKKDIIFFYDGFSEIMQIGLFFILGLLSNFQDFFRTLPVAIAIMLFLTIVSRPVTVYGLMLPFKLKREQLNFISLAGIRGAAAIAFAIMAVNSEADIAIDIYHIVFGVCVLSALIQGSLMPYASRRWEMLDPNDTVLNTFNYYQTKADIGFLETKVHPDSSLVGKKVKELNLAFNFIIAKIERDGKTVIPRGNVVIQENDSIILAGERYFDLSGQELIETNIPSNHDWVDQKIMDLDLPSNHLIIMIQRGEHKIVVPLGVTTILKNDKIVMIKVDEELESPVIKVDDDDEATEDKKIEIIEVKDKEEPQPTDDSKKK